jgi:hypothetical protein
MSNGRLTKPGHILLLSTVLLSNGTFPTAHGQNCPGSDLLAVELKARIKKQTVTRTVSVQKIGNAVLFRAGMQIDVDGAPNAYGPGNTGLDYTQNAKDGDTWAGVATDVSGNPVLQKTGPYQGYYVSTTSLQAAHGDPHDPNTYVDATKLPYIVLPPAFVKQFGILLGDLAVAMNEANGKAVFAIYADVGPRLKIGEGSLALARALGFLQKQADPRHGGVSSGIKFLVFPKSGLGPGKLRRLDEINTTGAKLLHDWGGLERMIACASSAAQQPANDRDCLKAAEVCTHTCDTKWIGVNNMAWTSCIGKCREEHKCMRLP